MENPLLVVHVTHPANQQLFATLRPLEDTGQNKSGSPPPTRGPVRYR